MQLKALDDRALDHVAAYFRALSEPLRLKILNALRDKVRNVGELTQMLDCSQANVSKHLAVLTRHGFIERSARGTTAFYRIADPRVSQLCDLVCGQMAQRFADQAKLLGATAPASRSRR
jgi:DNA-binding transcriptional ArsR family regulator